MCQLVSVVVVDDVLGCSCVRVEERVMACGADGLASESSELCRVTLFPRATIRMFLRCW